MNDVNRWLSDGGSAEYGLKLLERYCPNPNLARLVSLNPQRFKGKLISVLTPYADTQIQQTSGKKFREEWKFLSDPNCPQELKILAADKITAYLGYVTAHAQLSSCTNEESCYETAKKVVENYIENRKILSEFEYYRDNGKILGKHPIFEQSRRLAELREMSVAELAQRKLNLQKNIWRLERLLKKGDKPHLDEDRKTILAMNRKELAEIARMIEKR